MVSEKKRQKELKQPDEFQKQAFHLADWSIKHKQSILMVVIPLFAIIIGAFSWDYLQKKQGEDRREDLQKIDQVFAKEAEAVIKKQESLQKELMQLQKKLSAAEGSKKADDKSQVEIKSKLSALEKEMKDSGKVDHKESLVAYKEFYDKNSSTVEGWRSALSHISIQIQEKKYKEASMLAKEVLEKTSKMPFYQLQVRSLYISLLEEQEKYEEALAEVKTLVEMSDEDFKAKALLTKGRLLLLSSQRDQAFEAFDELIGNHNASQEAQKAKAIKALW